MAAAGNEAGVALKPSPMVSPVSTPGAAAKQGDDLVAGQWSVTVSSAEILEGDGAEGSVVMQFAVGAAGLQGSAVDGGGNQSLERVNFEPASGSLSFEQKASPGQPKVVWSCTVQDGSPPFSTLSFSAGKILSDYVVVAHFAGVKLASAGPTVSAAVAAPFAKGGTLHSSSPPQNTQRRRHPSKPRPDKKTESGTPRALSLQPARSPASSPPPVAAVPASQPAATVAPVAAAARAPNVAERPTKPTLTDSQASQLLLNLDRDHALAAAVFPTTLDDNELRRLSKEEVDGLVSTQAAHLDFHGCF